MRAYIRLIIIYTVALAAFIIIGNVALISLENSRNGDNYYKLEINRALSRYSYENIVNAIEAGEFTAIIGVERLLSDASAEQRSKFYNISNDSACYTEKDGEVYKFIYKEASSDIWVQAFMNIVFVIAAVVSYGLFIAVYFIIIRPFEKIKNFPSELQKGQLTHALPQQKSRLYKSFISSMNLLKDNLDKQKEKELKLQKEKQTLILSISHDIKTPLSAIKLYSKALSERLYTSEEKKLEAAQMIDVKADEIRACVDDIIKASTEDFMNMSINNGEFYLSELVERISSYYKQKLSLTHTQFRVSSYENCLLKGDFDRICEVVNNFIENAVKYGDGILIELLFSIEEDCLLFTVRNSGCSLKKDEITHIFDCFKRGSNSDGIAGSGLGLYIARKLCMAMGGDAFAKVDDDFFLITAVIRKV